MEEALIPVDPDEVEVLQIDAEQIRRFIQVVARILVARTLREEISQIASPSE